MRSPLTQYAPGFKRPYMNAYNLGIQREIVHGVSGTFEWFYGDGNNPLPIVLPCHRVVGANGKLVGYAGGLDRKETLLRLEGALL